MTSHKILIVFALLMFARYGFADEYYHEETIEGYTYGYYRVTGFTELTLYMGKKSSGTYVRAISPKPVGDFSIGFKSIKGIRANAFEGCDAMTSVVIPDKVTFLGENTFANCAALTNVTLSPNIGSISVDTFTGCLSLASFSMNGEGVALSVQNGVLYDLNKTKLIKYPPAKTNECFTIPDSVSEICEHAFEGSTNLVTVCLPTNLTKIGVAAFKGCTNLREIEAPIGITTVANETFMNCQSLTNAAFACKYLDSIGESALRGCNSLQHFAFTNVYGSIGDYAFENTGIRLVEISNVTLGRSSFSNCSQLKEVNLAQGDVASYSFLNCAHLKEAHLPHCSIGTGAFYGCEELSVVEFSEGDSEYYVYDDAFRNCKSLKTLTFNDGMRHMGFRSLGGCSSLTNLVIPIIGSQATFVSGDRKYPDYVFPYIFGSDQYEDSYLVQPYYDRYDRVYEGTYTTNFYMPKSLKSVRFTQATRVPHCAFEGCSEIRDIQLPETVKSIGMRAFWNCWHMKSIAIPEAVTTINYGTMDVGYRGGQKISAMPFGGNCSIQSVAIPGSAPALTNLFASCQYITNVVIQSGSTALSQGFLANCTALESVVIPETVAVIDDYAFLGCTSLESVYYRGNAPSLGGNNIYAQTPNTLTSYVLEGSKGWNSDPKSTELPASWPVSILWSRAIQLYVEPEPGERVDQPTITLSDDAFSNPYVIATITCPTDGAEIHYTLDGTTPTDDSPIYNSPITIYKSLVIKAIGFKDGYHKSAPATKTLMKSDAIGEAANIYSVGIDNDPDAPWEVDANFSHDGVSSVKSAAINHGETTSIQTSIKKAGTISFWWYAKCENPDEEEGEEGYYDYAEFLIDDESYVKLAGNDTGWKNVSVSIPTGGKHVFVWRYVKDASTTFKPDCVWVDQIEWIPADGSGHTYSTPQPVPYTWLDAHGLHKGSDYETAANKLSGKYDRHGNPLRVWSDYIVGSSPNDIDDIFTADIWFEDDIPCVNWMPYLNTNQLERTYKIKGKTDLNEATWKWPIDSISNRFFKIEVSLPDGTGYTDAPGPLITR